MNSKNQVTPVNTSQTTNTKQTKITKTKQEDPNKKINNHTPSIDMNNLYNIKLGVEKNVLNLDDVKFLFYLHRY
jgi:hypothetical protein